MIFKKSAYNLYNTIKGNSVLKQMCNNFGNIENTTIVLLYQMKFLGKYKYGLLNSKNAKLNFATYIVFNWKEKKWYKFKNSFSY